MKNSILSKISKIGIKLYLKDEKYLQYKKKFLNNKKVITYLFNKPLEKITSLHSLISLTYDNTINLVRLELNDNFLYDFDFIFLLLNDFINYFGVLKKYTIRLNNHNLSKWKFHNFIEPTIYQHKIIDILEEMPDRTNNKLLYVYNWTFLIVGNHTNLNIQAKMNYQSNEMYDFYGIITNYGQMIHFVILYDDDSHFDMNSNKFIQIHQKDIMIQYFLYQMNINLLRLSKKSDFKKEIYSFMDKIRNTTSYILQNQIKPIPSFFKSKKENIHLTTFCDDYEYNHKIYLTNTNKKKYQYDWKYDNFFEKQSIKNNYSKIPMDEGIVVPKNFLKGILKEKEGLHIPKEIDIRIDEMMFNFCNKVRNKNNEIIVKLVGEDEESIEVELIGKNDS